MNTITKTQSMAYVFICGAQREDAWLDMAFPKDGGDVGLKDFYELHTAATIKRAERVWKNDSIWASWVHR